MKAIWELCFTETHIRIGLILQTYRQFCPAENNKIRKEFHTIYNWIFLKINIPDKRLIPLDHHTNVDFYILMWIIWDYYEIIPISVTHLHLKWDTKHGVHCSRFTYPPTTTKKNPLLLPITRQMTLNLKKQ